MELEGLDLPLGAERLQKIPIFQRLSFEETTALASLVRELHAGPDTVLVEEGALGQALFLIVQGQVRVDRKVGAQTELLGHLGEGQMFGEMSLIDDLLTSARVVAEGEADLLVIDRAPFEKLLERNERLALKVYKAFCRQLTERLRKTNALLADTHKLLGHTS